MTIPIVLAAQSPADLIQSMLAAILATVLALQAIATILVANLPAAILLDPKWGPTVEALHRFGAARFFDEPGSLKLPGSPLRTAAAPPPSDPQAGFISVGMLKALLLMVFVGVVMQCVHPTPLPPVTGCTPGTTMCVGDAKMVCSSSRRWEPAGDEPCSVQGRVCAETDAGARCVHPHDAGAPDADPTVPSDVATIADPRGNRVPGRVVRGSRRPDRQPLVSMRLRAPARRRGARLRSAAPRHDRPPRVRDVRRCRGWCDARGRADARLGGAVREGARRVASVGARRREGAGDAVTTSTTNLGGTTRC